MRSLCRVVAAAGLGAVTWLAWRAAVSTAKMAAVRGATVDDVVAAAAAVGLVLLLAWVWAALIAYTAAALPGLVGLIGAAMAAALTPAACRGAVRVLLGLSAVSASTTPAVVFAAHPTAHALATTSNAEPDADVADLPGVERPAMVAGWVPTVPEPTPPAAPHFDVRVVATAPSESEAVLDEVVVRRGDTLWDIAARALGAQATAAEVAAEWPRWYAANRDVVGADPDLIYPGTVLRAPAN